MRADELRAVLEQSLEQLAGAREELRALDAAIGDGDLGITVGGGALAVKAALEADAPGTPAEILRLAAKRFAAANPSTMSALVATGLLAGSKAIGDAEGVDREAALAFVRTAADRIAERGGAQLGDKTILDALLPSVAALAASDGDARSALDAMVEAARRGVEETTGLTSQRGRAAWVGERSAGHPDGGATAYLRFLEALRDAWPVS